MKTISGLFVLSYIVTAQTFTFGVKGGAFITDPAEQLDQSRPYTVGPSFEVALPARFAVEANALYSRFGSSWFPASSSATQIRGNSWEFPVVGKHYFAERSSSIQPFASAGVAFRQIWLDGISGDRFGRRVSDSTDVAVGAVVAGGVALKAGRFRIAPEARYTRWGGYNYPATNPNQAQVLLGVTF
jgi:hypothetical protein